MPKSPVVSALRWVLVLPVAVVVGLLSTFPMHWVLTASCSNSMNGPARDELERLITGATITFFFIFSGARTAPTHQVPTATALAGIMLVLHLGGRLVAPKYFPGVDPWAWFPLVLSLAAIGASVFAVAKQEEEDRMRQPPATEDSN